MYRGPGGVGYSEVDPERRSMDFDADIERQRREMEAYRQHAMEATINERMRTLGIERNLAEYLVGLEIKIQDLERKTH